VIFLLFDLQFVVILFADLVTVCIGLFTMRNVQEHQKHQELRALDKIDRIYRSDFVEAVTAANFEATHHQSAVRVSASAEH
jgi:hypothetical protein